MRTSFFFFFLMQFTFCTLSSFGQDLKSHYDKAYNRDPELYNGIIFTDIYTRSVVGTQFYEENTFRRNSLSLQNKSFEDQYINYDVYHQKLLLTYIDDNYAQKMVEIPTENIRHFYIGSNYFEVLKDSEGNHKFYQVYSVNESKLLLYWVKYMKTNSTTDKNSYRFGDMQKQIWVLQNGNYTRIKSNKDLLSLYTGPEYENLGSWLKENKIKVQKASNSEIELLVNFLSKEE